MSTHKASHTAEPGLTQEDEVVAEVFLCRDGEHNKYWVIFTTPGLNWIMTYYGRIGSRGKTTVKHNDYTASHYEMIGSKLSKGYREDNTLRFKFPVKLLAESSSTNTRTGNGGKSVVSTDLILEGFFKAYREIYHTPPPCGSVAKKLFVKDPDAFRKASHMEPLGFDPMNQELYEAELDMWETYSFLVG